MRTQYGTAFCYVFVFLKATHRLFVISVLFIFC